jgi:hypothetical protein
MFDAVEFVLASGFRAKNVVDVLEGPFEHPKRLSELGDGA